MTLTVGIVTIADSISNLSISGVSVKDIDQIPESALSVLPVLFPRPQKWITDISFPIKSLGGDENRAIDCTYVMNYRYLHAVVGSGGGLLAVYASLIANLILIVKAILSNSSPTGAIDMSIAYITDIGVLTDPAGETQYHGVEFGIRILEFVQ